MKCKKVDSHQVNKTKEPTDPLKSKKTFLIDSYIKTSMTRQALSKNIRLIEYSKVFAK